MQERLEESTLCPHCTNELNDDDGEFFNKLSDVKTCNYCEYTIEYVKQFEKDYGNPYCDYVWSKTYMIWELDK
ncbi:MAG: hypothetical protein COB67_00645 [SAR324 cluster bacterium]|uniref:Uncharacterized protein n=1 Tax=SAR324 cluster bacterium TaxID=2024889 RepID=A0A2A4TCY9_9DELT|nr:MAG: hypothetical protein COB67_00645 [SAR324 cluster bacterium]